MKLLLSILILLTTFNVAVADEPLPAGHKDIKPVIQLPYDATRYGRKGWEERGHEFIKWNATGVRIGGASGTMAYYDKKENWMYIISCGHMFGWTGRYGADYYKRNPAHYMIDVFYQNDVRLPQPKQYKAQLLCFVWIDSVHDVSLLRFRPDWNNPRVSHVVPKDYKGGDKFYHSIGCDGRTEVAHYLVNHHTRRESHGVIEIITNQNAPRGGRSGGGLFNDKGELLGICSRGGGPYGYFSDWSQIHNFLTEEGYGFVLKSRQSIPILDRNNPQGQYDDDYEAFPQQN